MKKYSLPDLPYAYGALDPLYNKELLELHHTKHHAAYVRGANSTLERLQEARGSDDYSTINQLQKNLAFHISGHVLHSLFWKNMSPQGGGEPPDELGKALTNHFGSVDRFRRQMSEAGKSLQGSGWVALSWEALGEVLIVEQVHDHQGNTGSATLPLLVIDCWEHAFYLQYRNEKAKWIEAFWELVNWNDVAERLTSVSGIRY